MKLIRFNHFSSLTEFPSRSRYRKLKLSRLVRNQCVNSKVECERFLCPTRRFYNRRLLLTSPSAYVTEHIGLPKDILHDTERIKASLVIHAAWGRQSPGSSSCDHLMEHS